MPGKNYAGGCSTCCGCPSFTVTVNNHCGGAHIVGASVTIGADTQVTNGSGVATFTTAAKGAVIAITATGFCDGSSTVPTNCAARTVELYPTTIPLSLSATLSCSGALGGGCTPPFTVCCPTADYPVTVTVDQTAGGGYSDSVELDSCDSATLQIPAPCPNSGTDYTYDITWESPGFDTQVTTLTLPNASGSWLCSATRSASLLVPDTDWLFPSSSCVGTPPASLTVVLAYSPGSACPDGTYTVPLVAVNDCKCGALYQAVFPNVCTSVGMPNSLAISVAITQDPGDPCSCVGSIVVSGCAGLCTNVFTNPDLSYSGTFCCPIAFTATKDPCDLFGNPCTATVSE
jgi:hypothetical protein